MFKWFWSLFGWRHFVYNTNTVWIRGRWNMVKVQPILDSMTRGEITHTYLVLDLRGHDK